MKLPREKLLKGCKNKEGIDLLLSQAELVFKTWQPIWSPFISAQVREEAINIMQPLNDLFWHCDGGHPGAQRQRMQCIFNESQMHLAEKQAPLSGLRIEGNFLFDKPTNNEIRKALENIGIQQNELGDIWVNNDRRAEAICSPEAAIYLNGKTGEIRNIQINCEAVTINQLQLPANRSSRSLTTIESSLRIDAIASSGFGLSRSKVVNQIKAGQIKLNWEPIRQSSKELIVRDRIQHETRGSLEVINIELTKRQRWRIELLRS